MSEFWNRCSNRIPWMPKFRFIIIVDLTFIDSSIEIDHTFFHWKLLFNFWRRKKIHQTEILQTGVFFSLSLSLNACDTKNYHSKYDVLFDKIYMLYIIFSLSSFQSNLLMAMIQCRMKSKCNQKYFTQIRFKWITFKSKLFLLFLCHCNLIDNQNDYYVTLW